MSDFYNNTEVIEAIKVHAYLNMLEENCGIVINDEVIQGKNVHEDKRNHFLLDNSTFQMMLRAIDKGDRVITYHTHVTAKENYFSANDAIKIVENNIPALLYNHATKKVFYRDPTLIRPYIDRQWIPIFQNCYTLVSDWIDREMGIRMDHFQLFSEDEWFDPKWNRFVENLGDQGFKQFDKDIDKKRGDFILMTIGDVANPNHIAVMVNETKNLILHHLQDHLSKYANYGEEKRKYTHSIWRHESLC